MCSKKNRLGHTVDQVDNILKEHLKKHPGDKGHYRSLIQAAAGAQV